MFKLITLVIGIIGFVSSLFIESSSYISKNIKIAETYIEQAETFQKEKALDKADKNYKESLKIYDELLKFESPWVIKEKVHPYLNDMLLERKANCLKELGQYKESQEIYKKLIETSSSLEAKSRAQFQIGECYFKQEMYEDALREYQITIEKYAGTTYIKNAKFAIGYCYLKLNRLTEAIETFHWVEETYPESDLIDDCRFYILTSLFNAKEYKKVIEEYLPFKENVAFVDSEFKDNAMFLLAESYSSLENWQSAKETYNQIYNKFEGREIKSKALISIADCELELRNNKEALKLYEQVEKDFPDTQYLDEVYYGKSKGYYNLGNFEEAINYSKKAVETYPNSRIINEIYYQLGLSYIQLMFKKREYIKESISAFKKVEIETDVYPMARLQLTKVYQEIDIEEAIKECKEILNSNVSYKVKALAQFNIGEIYFSRGDFEKAIIAYQELIDKFKDTEEANLSYLQIGMCYYELKEYDKAKEIFDLQMVQGKNKEIQEQAKFNLGLCYNQLKEYDKAISIFEEIEKGDGVLQEIAKLESIGVLEKKDEVKAIKEYEKIIENEKTSKECKLNALFKLGMIWFNKEKYEKAIEIYDKFYQESPFHEIADEVLYQIGFSYYKLQKYGKANEYFEKLLKQFPNKTLVSKTMSILISSYNNVYKENTITKLQELKLEGEAETCRILEIGILYNEKEQYDTALKYFKEAENLVTMPDNKAMIIYNEGLSLKGKKLFEEAMKKFKIITTEYKSFEMLDAVSFEIGECLKEMQNSESAIAIFDQITKTKGRFYEPSLFELGIIYCDNEDYEKALSSFSKIIVSSSTSLKLKAQAQFMLGNTYYIAGVFEKAIPEFLKAIEKYNDKNIKEKSLYFLAESYYNLKEFEKAISAYSTLINEFPKSEDLISAYMSQAASYVRINEYDKAVEIYYKVAEKYNRTIPQVRESKLNIGNIYYTVGKFELSEKIYKEIIRDFPNTKEAEASKQGIKDVYEKLGVEMLSKGERLYKLAASIREEEKYRPIYDKAIKIFNEIILKYSDTIAAINAKAYIGTCYENMEEINKAYKIYEEMILQYEKREDVASLLGYIKERIKELEDKIKFMGGK